METEKEIKYYYTQSGKCPFLEWRKSLDVSIRLRVNKRIEKLADGLYGDHKPLQKSKLSELRMDFGKGYRIYYTIQNDVIVLLLNTGDKSKQSKDIELAKTYLKNIKDNKND